MKRKFTVYSLVLAFMTMLFFSVHTFAAEKQEALTETTEESLQAVEGTAEKVQKIDISSENAAVRYLGYEYVPNEFFVYGENPGNTIFIKFEYTNKRESPSEFSADYDITFKQNDKEPDRLMAYAGDADLTNILNYGKEDVVNETLQVYFPVIMYDYSPVTVTVTALSTDPKVTQTMEIAVEAPESVIVPNEQVAEPAEFVATWINPDTGDYIDVTEGELDPDTGVVKGQAGNMPADHTLNGYSSGFSYTLNGDIFTLGDERFQISKENEKLYLTGLDTNTRFIRRDDYLKFEDAEIHHMGDIVSTDMMELTVNGLGYAEAVDPVSLGGNVSVFQKEMLVPESGMIWAKIDYNLNCKSAQAVSLQAFDTNVRFGVVYQNSYIFEMDRFSNNYITKGYGGDEHVEWLGRMSQPLSIAPLVSEDFSTWLPVPSAVRDDSESPHHILVLLPSTAGTKLFVYDVTDNTAQSGDIAEETTAEVPVEEVSAGSDQVGQGAETSVSGDPTEAKAESEAAEASVTMSAEEVEAQISQQPVHVQSVKVADASEFSEYNLIYKKCNYILPKIINNSEDDIKDVQIWTFGWDENNLPVTLEYRNTKNNDIIISEIGLIPGATANLDNADTIYPIPIDYNCRLAKAKCLVAAYRTYSGDTWKNPLTLDWVKCYNNKKLEEPVIYTDAETVKKVQEALNAAGYDCGTPDGLAGSKTYAALNAYQSDNGLVVSNDITDSLLTALGLAG